MDIEELEELGVADLALDLRKFTREFLDERYPLTKEDISSKVNDIITVNVHERQEANNTMYESMNLILERVALENKEFLEKLNNGEEVVARNQEQEQELIRMYKEEMLKSLCEYQNGPDLDNKKIS